MHFVYEDKLYQLSTGKPGGLFVYDEPVKINIEFKEGAVKGESKKLKYKLIVDPGSDALVGHFKPQAIPSALFEVPFRSRLVLRSIIAIQARKPHDGPIPPAIDPRAETAIRRKRDPREEILAFESRRL